MSHRNVVKCLFLLVASVIASPGVKADPPTRKMGVNAGPDKVFMRPVAEIMPQLKGATATHVNGRVGPELVFWGYKLDTGKAVNLFACVDRPGVDCQARIPLICANGMGTLLSSATEPGGVVERSCIAITKVGPGDLHPGCTDSEISNNLQVGLVSCPGS